MKRKHRFIKTSSIDVIMYASLFIFFIIKIYFISKTTIIDDEAYYAMYARHLSSGYIDHGPGIALFIKWSILLFGESSFGIRFAGVFCMSILSYILFVWAKYRYNQSYALLLVLLFSTILPVFVTSIVLTPDTPMIFFIILSIIFYHDAFFINKSFFYPAGIALGLAMLSKISIIFIALSFFVYPLFDKNRNKYLQQKEFYFSFIIAAFIFLPFIMWNINNEFSFIKYQGGHITRGGSIIDFIKLWAAQIIIYFPIFFLIAVYLPFKFFFINLVSLLKAKMQNSLIKSSYKKLPLNDFFQQKIFFATIGIVPLLYFIIHSLFSKFEVNWPAPAFLGGLFCAPFFFLNKTKKNLFRIQISLSLLFILIFIMQSLFCIFPISKSIDITNRYYTYKSSLDNVKDYLNNNPEYMKYRIVSNNFQMPSMVNVLVKPPLEAICLSINYHETLYSFLYTDISLIGNDFLYIAYGDKFPKGLINYFSTVKHLKTFQSYRNEKIIQTISLWLTTSYTGKKQNK